MKLSYQSVLSLTLVSFLVVVSLSPTAIRLSKRIAIFDIPDDGSLKIHREKVPSTGGVILLLGIGSVLLLCRFVIPLSEKIVGLLVLCLLVTGLGLLDDIRNVNPTHRLLAQFAISLLLIALGFRVDVFPSIILNLVATVLIGVGTMNALNLLDGIDGLAAGVTAVCSLTFVIISLLQNNHLSLMLSSVLLGSTLGVLPYNFYPARLFLGDNGSTLLGFLLSVLVISSCSRQNSLADCVAAITALGLPYLDTFLAILRRIRAKRSIFKGDREHIYDKMIEKGFPQRQTAIIGYAISLGFGLLGLGLLILLR